LPVIVGTPDRMGAAGCQLGEYSRFAAFVRTTAPEPVTFITSIGLALPWNDSKAIFVPSGEKTGWSSPTPGPRPLTRLPLAPSASIIQMRRSRTVVLNRSKTIFVPSGDQSGDVSDAAGSWWVSAVWPVPLALMIQIESVIPGAYRSKTILLPSGENRGEESY